MLDVKVEKFEGPLGLLLKIIEKEEMDITQICLAGIADQFVNYIRSSNKNEIDPEEMADFLVVAAKLLLIKSKALLPYLLPDEEEDIEELEQQLKMYKEFVEAAGKIEKMLGKKKFMFAREFNRKVVLATTKSFSPPKKIESRDMALAFEALLTRIQPAEKIEEDTIEDEINIDDRIDSLKEQLIKKITISFNKVMANSKNKTEIIVNFLAMLEMMRQREVNLSQDHMFGDITINKKD
jgi:segregation and condensation protein A